MQIHTVSILVAGLLASATHLAAQGTALKTQLTDVKRLVSPLVVQHNGGGR